MAKDFNDFLLSFDEESIELIADIINKQKFKFQFPLTSDNINEFITSLLAANNLMTVKLLQRYHSWLTG